MTEAKLVEFIIRWLVASRGEDELYAILKTRGWAAEEIRQALARARELLDPQAPPLQPPVRIRPVISAPVVDLSRVTVPRLLLFLGAVVIVSAAVIFISASWEEWSGLQRFSAIAAPMVACALAGWLLWRFRQRVVGIYFLLCAGLLLPFVLFTAVWGPALERTEYYLGLPAELRWGLTLAVATFIYLLCRWVLPHPSWSLLAAVGLIMSAGFSFAELSELGSEAAVFRAALAASLIVLAAGLMAERKGLLADAALLYFAGWAGTAFSLLVLGFSGGMLPHEWVYGEPSGGGRVIAGAPPTSKPDLVGVSTALAGVVALLLAHLSRRLAQAGFSWQPYQGLLGFLGCGMLLLGAFIAGADGKLPLYETSFLVLSLLAVFTGQRLRVRSFLYLGTLFVIVYVFAIGFEYFEDQVGWPVVLFCAGLISMALGFAVERWSRSARRDAAAEGETRD